MSRLGKVHLQSLASGANLRESAHKQQKLKIVLEFWRPIMYIAHILDAMRAIVCGDKEVSQEQCEFELRVEKSRE